MAPLNRAQVLHLAIKKGDKKRVEELLEKGYSISLPHPESNLTPLHNAAAAGQTDILKLLLAKGAVVDSKLHKNDVTPLHLAANNNNSYNAMALLDHGADINAKTSSVGYTPIHLAAKKGYLAVVKVLVERGADLKIKNGDDFTPLLVAAYYGHAEVVEHLLENGSSITETCNYGKTALHYATSEGKVSAMEVLLRNEAPTEMKEKLNGDTPLLKASMECNIEAAKLLLKYGADIEARSTKEGDTPLLILLSQAKVGVNVPNVVAFAKLLVSHGADYLVRCDKGSTPFWWSARLGITELMEFFYDKGVPVTDLEENEMINSTALHAAANFDQKKAASWLIKHDAELERRSTKEKFCGCTPLHIAAHHGSVGVLEILLEAKADCNAAMKNGDTALHLALKSNTNPYRTAQLLIRYGADPTIKNIAGESPINHVDDKGSLMSRILRTGSAFPSTAPYTLQESQTGTLQLTDDAPRDGAIAKLQSKSDTEYWYKRVDKLRMALSPDGNVREYERVRIAILGSGIRPGSPFIPHVKSFKDFASVDEDEDEDTSYIDEHGVQVGTKSAELIARIAPEADIYVARVYRKSRDKDCPGRIEKALIHSLTEWKADIIILPSGFKDKHDGMWKEIHNACANKVLLFVGVPSQRKDAASVHDSEKYASFPQDMYGLIIRTYMCDMEGKMTDKYISARSEKDIYNLAFWGENVKIHPYDFSDDGYPKAIGAAIAALLLDFSRQEEVIKRVENIGDLRTVAGMQTVFRAMAELERGFLAVSPWRLLNIVKDGPMVGKVRETKRNVIMHQLSFLLDHVLKEI